MPAEVIVTPTHGECSELTVDPRAMAQRVLAIREQLAREFTADLRPAEVKDAGFDLLREALNAQLKGM